ncbi:hypothetical protein J3R82DRAFT_153 [Butyriboletus roseoflavus]|nr:hypothetical protein J3R82DRAFT_153 [Butyriboletus roseoflavus]
MGSSRTLEWACAAARLAGKEGRRRPCARERDRDGEGEHDGEGLGIAGDETEEDDIEAVTPEGSLGALDAARWHGMRTTRTRLRLPPPTFAPIPNSVSVAGSAQRGEWHAYVDALGSGAKDAPQDEDMMRAALALCGLGRRSG